jgi:tRNA1Val (adenine37-N6)-methyltransferase
MKVCTDACLFGAWIAKMISEQKIAAQNILDIGSGTGLLSLMIAQKSTAVIDGVEIDKDAWLQSVENVQQSPFKERVLITNKDVLVFQSPKKYDWIITNPPFFEQDLKSTNAQKNAARHDTTLQLNQLVQVVAKFIQKDGFFAVLLPYHRLNDCVKAAEKYKLVLCNQLLVKQTPKHPYFRCMLIFSSIKTPAIAGEVIIKNAENIYSEEFVKLLMDYYLHL